MDGWGFFIFIAGLILFYVTKRKPFFLFVSGLGAGLFLGAIWAMAIINQALH